MVTMRSVTAATVAAALSLSLPVTAANAASRAGSAVSAYGMMQSHSAGCATAIGAAGISAAGVAAGQAAQGCVLPLTNPVAPVAVDAAPVAAPSAGLAAGSGFLTWPAFLVAGFALAFGAWVVTRDDDDGTLPISVSRG